MRKLVMIAMCLLTLIGVFQLTTMTSVSGAAASIVSPMPQEMPDCPMGYVCPASFESARLLGMTATPRSLGLLLSALAVGIASTLAFFAAFRAALAPALVFTDTGPPALRSVFKKE